MSGPFLLSAVASTHPADVLKVYMQAVYARDYATSYELSTLAVELQVQPDVPQVVLIDLYVENQSDHQLGRYAVKVRSVRSDSSSSRRPGR